MNEVRVLSPTAILGYGYPMDSFNRGLGRDPHVLAVDAGSTDPGPYYLGSGKPFTSAAAVKRDLRPMLCAARERQIPLLVGSSGGAGAAPHLDWLRQIILELYREEGFKLRTAGISADVSQDAVKEACVQGRIQPCGPVSPLTQGDIESSFHIVAQMGTEPFLRALDQGFQVILAGRAYDPAAFAAVPIQRGFDPGLALHMGKILECAAIAAEPGSGSDCMLGTIGSSAFVLEALSEERTCTGRSVAAHTLYEKSDPYVLPGPGGALNLKATQFRPLSEGRVEVTGTRFQPDDTYRVKLEAAARIGYRTVSIAGVRDPMMIERLDEILNSVRDYVGSQMENACAYSLLFHCYGKNGVMGGREPVSTAGHEIGLVIEAVADTQEDAANVCALARSTLLHYGYPGRVSTAGNLAFPYSPSDFNAGEVYRFSIHHLMTVDDPNGLFPVVWEVDAH